MLTEEQKQKRDFRVWWQHLDTFNEGAYPKQEPFYTYEEAENKVKKEKEIHCI